jgi:hypothetical protein
MQIEYESRMVVVFSTKRDSGFKTKHNTYQNEYIRVIVQELCYEFGWFTKRR